MMPAEENRRSSPGAVNARQVEAADLSSHYENLAFERNDGDKGQFLSGWQCENPFVADFLAAVRHRCESIDHRRYTYFDDDEGLADAIVNLHEAIDGVRPESVLAGSGSSALLFSFVTFLRKRGVQRVYFVPPLYFTLPVALARYGIDAIPVAPCQPFEKDFALTLPKTEGNVLLLSDPIWYAGVSIPRETIDELITWQRRTSSTVFVDGSLQYLPWAGRMNEATAKFSPAATFRLLCPSKQLSVHGYRFAYILGPAAESRSLAWTYANINGPTSADSVAFAHEAVAALARQQIPKQLMELVASRHGDLRHKRLIESEIQPHCGYFVFEKVNALLPKDYFLVDGRFFAQPNYPGYSKINLLSPALHLISDPVNRSTGKD